MNYFRRKRIAKGISCSDMANMLDIDYIKYVNIDKGDRKMPTNLIDKFNEIINKGKNELKIEKLNREKEIDEWIKEMRVKKNGVPKLKGKMDEFNIDTYNDLAKLLGYSNGSVISNFINNNRPISYDFKNNLYFFFQNELNIQDKKKQVKVNNVKYIQHKKDLLNFYKKFNLKEWLRNKNISYTTFANLSNIPKTTIWYYMNGSGTPTENTIIKIKNAIESFEKENNEAIITKDVTYIDEPAIEKESNFNFKYKLINKYNDKKESLNNKIDELEKDIISLKQQIEKINEQKEIYDEIIEELQSEEI